MKLKFKSLNKPPKATSKAGLKFKPQVLSDLGPELIIAVLYCLSNGTLAMMANSHKKYKNDIGKMQG